MIARTITPRPEATVARPTGPGTASTLRMPPSGSGAQVTVTTRR